MLIFLFQPRDSETIRSRKEIMKLLKIENVVCKNHKKQQQDPSMKKITFLEMICELLSTRNGNVKRKNVSRTPKESTSLFVEVGNKEESDMPSLSPISPLSYSPGKGDSIVKDVLTKNMRKRKMRKKKGKSLPPSLAPIVVGRGIGKGHVETKLTKTREGKKKKKKNKTSRKNKLKKIKAKDEIFSPKKELVFEDIKEEDVQSQSNGGLVGKKISVRWKSRKPIPMKVCTEIKKILIGKRTFFSNSWVNQGFFYTEEIPYCLYQKEGGVCGVMAVVQAYILKYLFYSREKKSSKVSVFSENVLREALISSLCTILFNIKGKKEDTFILAIGKPVFSEKDLDFENFEYITCENFEILKEEIRDNISMFENESGLGLLSFVVSCILTRGIKNIKSDMDSPMNIMIVEYGYCSQELVNLLLVGKAHSNVFDNVKMLGSGSSKAFLKGIPHRSEIGFLTEFEIKNYLKVGNFLKTPKFPIYVIFSESHYSSLFLKRRVEKREKFSLFYCDNLERLEEEVEIIMSKIGPNNKMIKSDDDDPIVLNPIIKTKWEDWNVKWKTNPFL